MIVRINSVTPLDNYMLRVVFDDSKCVDFGHNIIDYILSFLTQKSIASFIT